jgi:hypothetical protein
MRVQLLKLIEIYMLHLGKNGLVLKDSKLYFFNITLNLNNNYMRLNCINVFFVMYLYSFLK